MRWQTPTRFLLRVLTVTVAAAAAFVAPAVADGPAPLPVHAAVAAWVQDHPGAPVPLIVQHDGTPEGLVEFVRASGGAVEREFDIIPALDVEVPAGRLEELARHGDVAWISLDAPVFSTAAPSSPSSIAVAFPAAVNAPQAWSSSTGAGVTVAVIDTGISQDAQDSFRDAGGGVRLSWHSPNSAYAPNADGFGHGTHVAGIVGGSSTTTNPVGKYTGIAPDAGLLGIRIADDEGNATVGDLMAGLQWVDENRDVHNIRVLNLSVNSSVAQSYKVDPLDAAVEVLWFHGVVVVVAAGNEGDAEDAVHYPPANDPFVITVGAFDDKATNRHDDDALAPWSSRGNTQDGIAKPEVLGPGANIVSPVSSTSWVATNYPAYIVEPAGSQVYFKMSGTSMATPAVAGVAALLLEDHPDWLPGQVKQAMMSTARSVSGSGQGVLADAALSVTAPANADDGIRPNNMLMAAVGVAEADFNGIRWRDALFNGIRWRGLELNGIRWRDVDWDSIDWSGIDFSSSVQWGGTDFTGIRWHGIRWRAFVAPAECNGRDGECSLGASGRDRAGEERQRDRRGRR
jgi:serine protease AprX